MKNKRKTKPKTKKANFNRENKLFKNVILGLFLLNSFFILFSFFGNTGFLGNFVRNIFQNLFGSTYFIFLLIMEVIYIIVLFGKLNKKNKNRSIMTLLLFFNYMAMVDLANNSSNNFSIKLAVAKNSIPKGSGYIGAVFGYFYNIMIGMIGLYIFTFIIGLFLILSFLDITFVDFLKIMKSYILKAFENINDKYSKYKEEKKLKEQSKEENANENLEITGNEDNLEEREIVVLDHSDNFSKDEEIETEEIKKEELLNSFNLFPDENLDIKINSSEDKKIEYKIPPLSLLKGSRVKETESEQTLKQRAKKIEATLKSFGVGAKVVRINKGPTVTCFELQPDMGVKVNKIVNLAEYGNIDSFSTFEKFLDECKC